MDLLAKADKKALTYGLAGTLVLTIGGAFWALPHIEDELDEESLSVASYAAADGYAVEWNGRDGYLTVPAGTDPTEAEIVAADLADIRGTRDVEISFAGDLLQAEEPPAGPVVEAEPTLTPAQFNFDWDTVESNATGVVPTEVAAQLRTAFNTQGWEEEADRALGAAATDTLTDVVAPLIGNEISAGRLSVDDDEITVTGVVADAATQTRLVALLESEPAISSVDLTVAEAVLPAATFAVSWDQVSVQQSGLAPADLSPLIRAFGVQSPIAGERLSVEDTVSNDLEALAPLVGTTLTSGSADVVDGALSITGRAASQADADAALAALAGVDGEVTIDVDLALSARADLDAILLEGLEFETNTNIPTPETEAIIDEIAAVLDARPEIAIEIVGHTDSRGNDEANQTLSESRAQAVLDGLVARGIDADRLSASGRGETEPVDSNETLEGQQNNRRVEIEIKENKR